MEEKLTNYKNLIDLVIMGKVLLPM